MADTDGTEGTDKTAAKAPRRPPPGRARASGESRVASPDPATLVAEIERTREGLAETLDAIADKVSPKRVVKRTTQKVTGSVKETAILAKEAVVEKAIAAKEAVGEKAAAVKAHEPVAPQEVVPAPILPGPMVPPPPGLRALAPPLSVPAPANGPLVRKEFVAAGVGAVLVALFVVGRRRRRR